jgi:membrane protein
LLALFPAVTAFVSLYGLFAKASTINEHFSLVSGLMPEGGVAIIQEQVNRIAAKGETKLGSHSRSVWHWPSGAPMPE